MIRVNNQVPRLSRFITDAKSQLTNRQFYRHQFLPTLLKQAYPDLAGQLYLTRGNGHRYTEDSGQSHLLEALQTVECAYLGRGADVRDGRVAAREVCEVFGDQAFITGILRHLEKFCAHQPSFLYYMDHQVGEGGGGGGGE